MASTSEKIKSGEFTLLSSADYFASNHLLNRNLTGKGRDATLKILEAARIILVEKGYSELTLREVSRAANVRLGNLQYYYPTRDALLEDLFKLISSAYEQRLEEIKFESEAAPQEKFSMMINFLFGDSLERSVSRLFFDIWALSQRADHVATQVAKMYGRLQARIEDIIEELSPEMPAETREERAACVLFFLEGNMVRMNVRGDRPSFDPDSELAKAIWKLAIWP
ncbi:TetR/AcrR family transcriptional regulator [Paracoccus aminophilus]|nr:TetR/AcrR family transcriptional regulator [Paracoccus aminophilus]